MFVADAWLLRAWASLLDMIMLNLFCHTTQLQFLLKNADSRNGWSMDYMQEHPAPTAYHIKAGGRHKSCCKMLPNTHAGSRVPWKSSLKKFKKKKINKKIMNPLPELLIYELVNHKYNSMKYRSKSKHFHSRKCNLKCSTSIKRRPFCFRPQCVRHIKKPEQSG